MRPDPPHTDAGFLWDMLTYAKSVVAHTTGMTLEDYVADENVRLATERRIEIIGEAARHVSDEYKTQHPEVPWEAIVKQRHVLAHDYSDISDTIIWKVVTLHVPALIPLLEPLVPQTPE